MNSKETDWSLIMKKENTARKKKYLFAAIIMVSFLVLNTSMSFTDTRVSKLNDMKTYEQGLKEIEQLQQTRGESLSQIENTDKEISQLKELIEIKGQEFRKLRRAEDKTYRLLTQTSLDYINSEKNNPDLQRQVNDLEKEWEIQSTLYQEAAQELTKLENELIIRLFGDNSLLPKASEITATGSQAVSFERRRFDVDDLDMIGLSISRHKEDDIILRFGNPIETTEVHEEYGMDYSDWKYLVYEGFTATVANYDYENDDFILNQLEIYGHGISGPRGIEIGDSVDDVLKHFPNENQIEIIPEGTQFLYGSEYAHKGMIDYDDHNEISLISFVHYIDTSYFAAFDLGVENERVVYMSIRF
jgi:hypothetical protein